MLIVISLYGIQLSTFNVAVSFRNAQFDTWRIVPMRHNGS